MVAHYNVYYHGEKIIIETIEDLSKSHVDDFTKLIEVYPYGDAASASSNKPKMEEVLKKASVVISKRSRSKWVDDCFLLIGKAHFFKGDYFSADEAFQFVNSQYSDRNISYDAKIWIIKTLVRQNKINDAEALYKTFQRDEVFPARLKDNLNCIAGDIYAKMGLYKEAQKYLELGLSGTRDKTLRYRMDFLLAQLYMITEDYELAKKHYRKVVRTNSPYEFAFQSSIGIVKANALSGKTDTRESRRNLKKMLRDDKNIDYYDQLYFELGNLDKADGNTVSAIKNYQMAVRKSTKNQDLKANAYLNIAKLYYNDKNYRMSQKFFDSTAMFITETHPEYEKIKLQQSVLSTLIDHLIKIHTNDSLLDLAGLSPTDLDERIKKIYKFEQDLLKKEAEQKEKNESINTSSLPINTTTNYGGTNQFIFENKALLGREYNEFVRRWGKRKLTDNWRISSIKKESTPATEIENKDTADDPGKDIKKDTPGGNSVSEELKKYYSNIPFTESDKALANKKILDGHFESGKIYYEKLKEYKQAIFHFSEANKLYPENQYEAEILFYMVKCYDALKDSLNTRQTKKKLSEKYPNSAFNQVFQPKDEKKTVKQDVQNEKREVLEAYEKMYEALKNKDYSLVKSIKAAVDAKYAGNAYQAKFDYLYALAVAKTDSLKRFVELLKEIVKNYPGTEIADRASYTIDVLENRDKMAKMDPNSRFTYDANQKHYFCLVTDEGTADRLKAALSNYNMKYHAKDGLKIKSFLLGTKDMLNVEILNSKSDGLNYYKSFSQNFKEFIPEMPENVNYFIISTDNFKTILKDMDDTEYLKFFKKIYL
ncbi:MAG: hypothetical protein H6605_04990 [Flavobacteriales bacterium]|nr:hypothetical protein [Flavobacteriales bacterium]